MIIPNTWENKIDVPNHQPVVYPFILTQKWSSLRTDRFLSLKHNVSPLDFLMAAWWGAKPLGTYLDWISIVGDA